MPKTKVTVDEALQTALADILKEYGPGAVMCLGDSPTTKVKAISTGSLALDLALGIGGVPQGRIIEIFGPESSGKTTLVQHIIANAQRQGGRCAFLDVEYAFDAEYAAMCGVDIKKLYFAQPESGEATLGIAEKLVNSGAFSVIVIDSIAMMSPQAELDGEMSDQNIGLMARLLGRGMRKLRGILFEKNCTLILTNQIRHKVGVFFGPSETTPGGNAVKFAASVRLDIRRIETVKVGSESIGNRVKVKVIKNKVAPPAKIAEFDIIYGEGISRAGSILDVGLTCGTLVKKGNTISYQGESLGVGREQARKGLTEDIDLMTRIEAQIREEVMGEPLPEEDDESDIPDEEPTDMSDLADRALVALDIA